MPVQYIGPGHSAPRDQCRGNTLPNSIFFLAQDCEHLKRRFGVLSAVYFDVVAILY